MRRTVSFKRKTTEVLFHGFAALASFFAISILAVILFEVLRRGFSAINTDLFTKLPTPPGQEGGGLANAIVGSLVVTLLAAGIGIPVGIMSAVYSAEFGRGTLTGRALKFATDILSSVPSIIVGLFVYTVVVVPMKSFSMIAGALALAMLTIPIVHKVTEEMLVMVPDSLREAGLALGVTYPVVVRKICLRSARVGIITGVLGALARISGETAPLLFTSLNSPFWNFSPLKPTATLNVTIFNYAMSPYDDWRSLAWGASFLITVSILVLTLVSRVLFKRVKNG